MEHFRARRNRVHTRAYPEKVDRFFFDSGMLQRFEFEEFRFNHAIPRERQALENALDHDRFKLNRSRSHSLFLLSHDLIQKVCNYLGSCSKNQRMREPGRIILASRKDTVHPKTNRMSVADDMSGLGSARSVR